jgi:hypothetical protein
VAGVIGGLPEALVRPGTSLLDVRDAGAVAGGGRGELRLSQSGGPTERGEPLTQATA